MKFQTLSKFLPISIVGPLIPIVLTACGMTTDRDDIARLQVLADACPANGVKLATYIASDVSDTGRSDRLVQDRRQAIDTEANRVAVCGGHLKVVAFSAGSAATFVLYEGDLAAEGATEQARLRRVDDGVGPVMATIDQSITEALNVLPGDGSDILSQYSLLAEYFRQHGGAQHRGLILSDGLQSSGSAVTNVPGFTEAVAADLAGRVPVPDLGGSSITIAGIGQVAGRPPPEEFVLALKVFFNDTCRNTHATCLVVTDLS